MVQHLWKLISTPMKQAGAAPEIDGNLRIVVRLMCPFLQGLRGGEDIPSSHLNQTSFIN